MLPSPCGSFVRISRKIKKIFHQPLHQPPASSCCGCTMPVDGADGRRGEVAADGIEMRVRVGDELTESAALRGSSSQDGDEDLGAMPWRRTGTLRVRSCAFAGTAACLFVAGMAFGFMAAPASLPVSGDGMAVSGPGDPLPWRALPAENAELSRIAFGSCANQQYPAGYLDLLSDLKPNLTVLGGDNVYGDCSSASCEELRAAYALLRRRPSWRGAAASLATIATWDDHDYGQGDGHSDNPYKVLAPPPPPPLPRSPPSSFRAAHHDMHCTAVACQGPVPRLLRRPGHGPDAHAAGRVPALRVRPRWPSCAGAVPPLSSSAPSLSRPFSSSLLLPFSLTLPP